MWCYVMAEDSLVDQWWYLEVMNSIIMLSENTTKIGILIVCTDCFLLSKGINSMIKPYKCSMFLFQEHGISKRVLYISESSGSITAMLWYSIPQKSSGELKDYIINVINYFCIKSRFSKISVGNGQIACLTMWAPIRYPIIHVGPHASFHVQLGPSFFPVHLKNLRLAGQAEACLKPQQACWCSFTQRKPGPPSPSRPFHPDRRDSGYRVGDFPLPLGGNFLRVELRGGSD